MAIKVKTEFEKKVIGFNRKSLPLGQRDDLHLLYEQAKQKGHKKHLEMFDVVDEAEVNSNKVSTFFKNQSDKKPSPEKSLSESE